MNSFLLPNPSSSPLYLWSQAKYYRGCMLVAERFENKYYPHYFDQYGDFALLDDAPCSTIEAALETARLAVDKNIQQAIQDGDWYGLRDLAELGAIARSA